MKTRLVSLSLAVLGTPVLGHAATLPSPPDGLCLHAQLPQFLIGWALQFLGHFC